MASPPLYWCLSYCLCWRFSNAGAMILSSSAPMRVCCVTSSWQHDITPGDPMTSIFDQDLPQTPANYAAMSPLSFIERSAATYPQQLAVVHGTGPQALRRSWSEVYRRCRQLASALSNSGIGKGDTVAVMLPNTPPMVEAHFGVPMAGAVLNTINTRLDPKMVAFMLDHGEAKVVIVDPEFAPTVSQALALRSSSAPIKVIDAADSLYTGPGSSIGDSEYEDFIAGGDPDFAWELPENEW